jgi:hypothetical protein
MLPSRKAETTPGLSTARNKASRLRMLVNGILSQVESYKSWMVWRSVFIACSKAWGNGRSNTENMEADIWAGLQQEEVSQIASSQVSLSQNPKLGAGNALGEALDAVYTS